MRFWSLVLCLLLIISSSAVVLATDPGPDNHEYSYDQAHRALNRGQILPLSEVIKYLRHYHDGDIVAIEYEYEFNRWVYEFKVIDGKGQMKMIHIGADDGALVQVTEE